MIESLLLVLSVCLDSFVASIAYGTNRIKIPLINTFIISLICTSFLGISLFLGALMKNFIPVNICKLLSFIILISLGLYRFFEGIFKTIIQNKIKSDKPLTFKLFDFNFVMQVYADETKADFDKSHTLSIKESIYLAIALSFDSLAVGFGSSLGTNNYFQIIIFSIVIGVTFILLGSIIGKKIVERSNLNLSWLSGIILIALAVIRYIK